MLFNLWRWSSDYYIKVLPVGAREEMGNELKVTKWIFVVITTFMSCVTYLISNSSSYPSNLIENGNPTHNIMSRTWHGISISVLSGLWNPTRSQGAENS